MDDATTVPGLLLEWGLEAGVIQRFIDEDVTVKCLALLGQEMADRLIEKQGPRSLFNLQHRQWIESLDKGKRQLDPSLVPVTAKRVKQLSSDLDSSRPSTSTSQNLTSASEPSRPSTSTSQDLTSASEPGPSHLGVLSIDPKEPCINDLHKELKNCPNGKIVLATYNRFHMLDSHSRDLLASACIFWEIGSDLTKRIPIKRYKELTSQIVELIPTEAADTWCEITTRKKRTIISGRLRHKFYNVRRQLLRVGLISKLSLVEELEEDEDLLSEADLKNDEILWLKNNDHPWTSVIQYWSNSRVLRNRLLNQIQTEEYVEFFPALRKHMGYELLLQDFALKFPEAEGRVKTHWPPLVDYLKHLLQKKIKGFLDTSTTPEQELVEVLCQTAVLFKPRSAPKPKGKTKDIWKISSIEAQTAFVLRIEEIGHLKDILDDRKGTLLKFGHTLQPVVVLVGTSNNIRQSLVVLNLQQWDCGSPLGALDACFKIFFALNTSYPVEARHIWLFVQQCVYNIKTTSDYSNDTGLKTYIASYINDFDVSQKLLKKQASKQ